MTSRASLDQPDDCLPIETPDTRKGWTERIENKLTTTRNRSISFKCQNKFTSNRRQCMAVETRNHVAKDKKAEIYLNEKNMLSNVEWNIGLKCSGKREWLHGKCSVVVVGQSAIMQVEAVMNKIDSLTKEMSKVPRAVLLPTKTELNMAARHPLSPALVRSIIRNVKFCSLILAGPSTTAC